MKPAAIDDDPDFRALERHADALLRAKGFRSSPMKGSTSWTDPRITPADAAVRFKLYKFHSGIFFGARQAWAEDLGVSLRALGGEVVKALPAMVPFCGAFVENNSAGLSRVEAIVALFP